MPGNVEQKQPLQIHCASCGRNFRFKPELAGLTMKCPCGTALRVPALVAGDDDDSGEYDVAEPAPAPAVARTKVAAVGLAAPPGSADAPHVAAAAAPLAINLPPQRKRLQPEPRPDPAELDQPSTTRDWVIPTALIVLGVALRFIEVTALSEAPIRAVGPALATVFTKLVLGVSLMLGGMFLAVQLLEVCFIGALPRIIYKLVAIAIAPGALYGLLTHVGGPMYGSLLGTFASVVVYGLLFWLLMRLDLKDASICVLMTWILITAANYVAYRAEGMIRDSWI